MPRSILICAGVFILYATSGAQQHVDFSRLQPVTAPIKNAGTINLITGKRTPASQQGLVKAGGTTIVFNNTCTWTGGAYYGGLEDCEDLYDGGRIPSTGPAGAGASNDITMFQIGYCTYVGPTTPVDIEVAFWDNLSGDCVGAIPPTPPAVSTTATAYFDLSGIGLPGSTAVGFQACWTVNLGFGAGNVGFTLQSDGEGTFDNDQQIDKFTWMWRHNNPNGVVPNGFLLAGEPATGGYGACSYNIACGTDALFGNTCGTGLDMFDAFWINVDGVPVGVTTSASCTGGYGPLGGTNCYQVDVVGAAGFVSGYPFCPLSGNWLELFAVAASTCGASFCTENPNSCTSASGGISGGILSASTCSVDVNSGTFQLVNGIVQGPNNPSILIYSATQVLPFPTTFGWLCLGPSIKRIPATVFTTSGSLVMTVLPPPGCTGSYTYNLHNFLNPNSNGTITTTGFPDPTIQSPNIPVGGTVRHFQAWYRDTPPDPARLSTGLTLTLLP